MERSALLLHTGWSGCYLAPQYDPAARPIILPTGKVKNINFEHVNVM